MTGRRFDVAKAVRKAVAVALAGLTVYTALNIGCFAYVDDEQDGGSSHASSSTESAVDITTSRLSGVAPLSVFFDLTGSTVSDDTELIRSTALWDFDDPDSGEQNEASGFVAGHVFNTPGTFNVSVEFYYPDGRQESGNITIEVAAFSGDTYYVAADGSDDNPGTIEEPLASFDYAIDNYANPNTRILFRQGDTFYLDTKIVSQGGQTQADVLAGPVVISSYSDPNSPSSEKPVIFSTYDDSTGGAFLAFLVDDWRLINLHFRAGGPDTLLPVPRYPSGIFLHSYSQNTLLQNLEFSNLHTGLALGGYYNTLHNSYMHTLGRTGIYSFCLNDQALDFNTGHSVIGNTIRDFDSDHREHAFRLDGIDKAFIAYNDFRANDTKTNVTVRRFSRYVILYRNILDRVTTFKPTAVVYEEHIHHCVAEANLFIARDYSGVPDNTHPSMDTPLAIAATQIMLRNNIIFGYDRGVDIEWHPMAGISEDIYLYNNTIIANHQNSSFVTVHDGSSPVVMRNNLFYNMTTEPASYADCFLRTHTDNDNPNVFSVSDIDSDYNLMYGENWSQDHDAFRYADYTDWDTLGEWQANSGNDLHSMVAVPLINTTVDMDNPQASLDSGFASPGPGSPALNSGQDVVVTDFWGRMRLAPDIGAIQAEELELTGSPGNETAYLRWEVNTTLPVTTTWRIDYVSDTLPSLVLTAIDSLSTTRAYTLTGLTNYEWYTVTLHAMVDSTSFLSDTVRVMVTDVFVYLPVVVREE